MASKFIPKRKTRVNINDASDIRKMVELFKNRVISPSNESRRANEQIINIVQLEDKHLGQSVFIYVRKQKVYYNSRQNIIQINIQL